MPIRKRSTAKPFTRSPAPTAESHSPHTEMPEGNTAATPATLLTASKVVMAMGETQFSAEMNYLTAISIVKNLREKGLLTEEEYAIIDTKLRADFSPSLATLLSENDWIN